jgi:hypothetical protein
MEYIEEELNRVISQKSLLDEIVDQSVLEFVDDIRKAIKDRWLLGDSVDGGAILNQFTGDGYSQKSYRVLKLHMNPKAGGGVDLTFTGSLGDKIIAIKNGSNDYEIISEDSKYNEIGSKYGFDEIGLTNDETLYFMKRIEESINVKLLNL